MPRHRFSMRIVCSSTLRVVPIWLGISFHRCSYTDRQERSEPIRNRPLSLYFPSQLNNCVLLNHDGYSYVAPNMTFPCRPTQHTQRKWTKCIFWVVNIYYQSSRKLGENEDKAILPVCTCQVVVPYCSSMMFHVVAGDLKEIHVSCIRWRCRLVDVLSKLRTTALDWDVEAYCWPEMEEVLDFRTSTQNQLTIKQALTS